MGFKHRVTQRQTKTKRLFFTETKSTIPERESLKSRSMKAIDLLFRETLTLGQFEMKSHVLVFIDEAGNEYSDTFSEVHYNGRFEAYQYEGIAYDFMQDLMEAIFLNKVNK